MKKCIFILFLLMLSCFGFHSFADVNSNHKTLGFKCQDTANSLAIDGHVTPLLKKHEIIEGYTNGIDTGATHMLIVWDTYSVDDSYDFIVYCYPEENVNDFVKYYNAPGYYRVSAVYAMHLDFEEQFKESVSRHN